LTKNQPSENADQPSFEESLKKLEEIVRLLEEGDIGLNDALARYEEGVRLLRRSYDLLEHAERRIEILSGVDRQGNPTTEPFDEEASSPKKKSRKSSNRPKGHPPTKGKRRPPKDQNDVDSQGGLF